MEPDDPVRGAALVGRVVFISSRGFESTRFGLFASGAVQTFAGQLDAVGVMDEAIQDGVGQGGNDDQVVPAIDGNLAGDDDRAFVVAVLDDFVEIARLVGVERLRPPIVEDEQLDAGERAQEPGVTGRAMRDGQIGEEARNAGVKNGYVLSVRLVPEGGGKPTLAQAGRANVILPGVRLLKSGSRIGSHPRAGDLVTVVGVRRHASADHLIVRQPDRTLALLPAWMTKTNGSSCELIQHPRLPLEKLAELHALVDTLLISLRGDLPSKRGAGGDGRATQPKRFVRTSNDAPRASVPSPDGAHATAPGSPDGSGLSGNTGRDGRSDRRGGR